MRELMNIYLTRFGEEREIFAPDTKWANVEQYDRQTTYEIDYKLFMHDEVIVGKYIGCTDGAKSLLFTDLSRPRDYNEYDSTRHYVLAIPTQNINSIVIAK
jgi:hypothetical protein